MKTIARWITPAALALAGTLALGGAERAAQAVKVRPLADRVVVARVVDDEPDDLGRVRVAFPWLPVASSSPIRFQTASAYVLVPLTPGDLGFFLPEVDDEVLVAFEGGDAARPVILGRLWDGEHPPAIPRTR
jgi:uncharacterized protein involved in type VI secretion and phage assembly